MNQNIFIINFTRFINWLTPNKLKQPRNINWITSLLYPLVLLYNSLLLYKKTKLYELKITPQKCYLEMLLNDRYDFDRRRIYIDDGKDKVPFYIYRSDELKPRYIHKRSEAKPKFIYTSGESGIYKDDFVVFVPIELDFDRAEMSSLLKVYKLAGTKFTIQTFGR